MSNPLVIVESPAKAKSIRKILGAGFTVEASVGHIRDLPASGEIPDEIKGQPWARLAIDIEHDFTPVYVVSKDRKRTVAELKAALKQADALYLATDEDREGEAIAWHLVQVLQPKVPVKRMVFHEITPRAIKAAAEAPRDLDQNLVEAQEARRIVDRLVGYEVSPVLWRRVQPGLSAGRVQSVAVRIVVERERERMAFVAADFASLTAAIAIAEASLDAKLILLDGRKIAVSNDFGSDGQLTGNAIKNAIVLTTERATELAEAFRARRAAVSSIETKPYKRQPSAPFRTSTMQQDASSRLGFGAQRTMRAAQSLYENGYITYMRTDSMTLSGEAITAARAAAVERFGKDSIPSSPRVYRSKVEGAQEAHEAIRPAGESFQAPDTVASEVGAASDEARLYDLIWKRTVASQMKDRIGETTTFLFDAAASSGEKGTFRTSGLVITDPGYFAVYANADPEDEDEQGGVLPALNEGDAGEIERLEAGTHRTNPPKRYTEASLIRKLEEIGVGRPSTYASIITTITKERGYLWSPGGSKTLIPSWTAFAVTALLEQHYDKLVDYDFTREMELELDEIAEGRLGRTPYLEAFWHGKRGGLGLSALVGEASLAEIDARAVNTILLGPDPDGVAINVRVGRYGPYLERGEDRSPIPEDLPPDELTIDKALELLAGGGQEGRLLGTDPATGLDVRARSGRFGPYIALGEEGEKPVKSASLFKSMTVDAVTLDEAVQLLALPRTLGPDPESGEPIEALNGRYGPYIRRGKDSRSLEREEQLFTVTVDDALELLKQPPRRRGQRAPAAPLKELGPDPVSQQPMIVKDGRYGPYVTDGTTNASLRRGDDVETLTMERASELLAERRASAPASKRKPAAKKRAPAKKPAAKEKAAAKKPPAKRKAPAKKPAAKRAPDTEGRS
jgi:DNA topoisomerase-1